MFLLTGGKAKVELKTAVPINMDIELKHIQKDEEALASHVLVIQEKTKVVVDLRLPVAGEFALGLYACGRDDVDLENVCNYLVTCKERCKSPPYPQLSAGKLGASGLAEEFNSVVISHRTDVITTSGMHAAH